MTQINKKGVEKSTPSWNPVKPKKPLPTKEETSKIPVPCSVLNEEQIRGIVRDEITKYMQERARYLSLAIIH